MILNSGKMLAKSFSLLAGGFLLVNSAMAQSPTLNDVTITQGQSGDVTIDWTDGGSGATGVQITGISLSDASDIADVTIFVTDLFSGEEEVCVGTGTTIAPNVSVSCNDTFTTIALEQTSLQPLGDLTDYARIRITAEAVATAGDIDITGAWQSFDNVGGDLDGGNVSGAVTLQEGPPPPAPELEFDPEPGDLTFSAQVGSTDTEEVSICNVGQPESELTIDSIAVSETSTAGGTFTESNDCGATLDQNQCCTVTVTFTSANGGNAQSTGTLNIETGDGDGAWSLTGISTDGPQSELELNPDEISFGEQDVSDLPMCMNVVANNAGDPDSTFTVTAVNYTGAEEFTIDDGCTGEGPGCSVEVCFDADEATGPLSGSIEFVTDANQNGTQSVPVSGEGTAEANISVNPPFGPVNLGESQAGETITVSTFQNEQTAVTNSGSADAEVSCSLTAGTDSDGVFSTNPSLAGPITVGAGATVPFSISCALPGDADDGDQFSATLSCNVDGEFAGDHELSCAVQAFQPIPINTLQPLGLALFALLMLLMGGISIRLFRAS